jgi:adenylyl-sulfate kinase
MKKPHEGFTLWFTGLPCAGKATLASLVAEEVARRGVEVELLDADVVHKTLSKGLGFSKEDRNDNIRRIGFVCRLLSRHGVCAMAAAISPYRAVRDEVRASVPNFVEVYVSAPVEVCIARDSKGLYEQALAGEIEHFTGVDDPYEPPEAPEVVVETDRESPQACAARILAKLEQLDLVPPAMVPRKNARSRENVSGARSADLG